MHSSYRICTIWVRVELPWYLCHHWGAFRSKSFYTTERRSASSPWIMIRWLSILASRMWSPTCKGLCQATRSCTSTHTPWLTMPSLTPANTVPPFSRFHSSFARDFASNAFCSDQYFSYVVCQGYGNFACTPLESESMAESLTSWAWLRWIEFHAVGSVFELEISPQGRFQVPFETQIDCPEN